jgi:hypothetical protein
MRVFLALSAIGVVILPLCAAVLACCKARKAQILVVRHLQTIRICDILRCKMHWHRLWQGRIYDNYESFMRAD